MTAYQARVFPVRDLSQRGATRSNSWQVNALTTGSFGEYSVAKVAWRVLLSQWPDLTFDGELLAQLATGSPGPT